MGTLILISSVAVVVAIVGCAVIWRLDARRADEVVHDAVAAPRPRLNTGETTLAVPGRADSPPEIREG